MRGGWRVPAMGGLLIGIVTISWVLFRSSGASPSFGPRAAQKLEVILAPGVAAEILPSAASLGEARFVAFDVSPSGAVIVSTGEKVFDMGRGDELFTARSFAFVGEALAVIDTDGNVGYYDGGTLQVAGEAPVSGTRLAASSDRTRLFFVRQERDSSARIPALLSMTAGSAPEPLIGSFEAPSAVGGDALQTLYAVKSALFQLVAPGRSTLLLVLPDDAQTITGLAVAGGAVYFATAEAVYTFEDGLVVPLVIGLGGDLRIVDDTLYVLEPRHGRVYRVVLRAEAAS